MQGTCFPEQVFTELNRTGVNGKFYRYSLSLKVSGLTVGVSTVMVELLRHSESLYTDHYE